MNESGKQGRNLGNLWRKLGADERKLKQREPRDGRNLAFLGVGAMLIAVVTTSLSLYIYHASGDIYLDRSRPGFLPDESEQEEQLEINSNNNYRFPENGAIDEKVLGEYLNRIKEYQKDLNDLADPYPEYPLSDQSLGIGGREEVQPAEGAGALEEGAPGAVGE